MDSHVVLPKCILRQFQNSKQSLNCYNTATKQYFLSRAKSFNTERNYYCIVVPISPTVAVYYRKCSIGQNFVNVDIDFVRGVNRMAFEQAERVGGFLIADSKQLLEETIQKI